VEKLGRERILEALGVSRYTLWRMIKGRVGIDDVKLRTLLSLITEPEFREVLSSSKLLEAANIVRPDGTVNYAVVMEILKKAAEDEYLKQLIIRFVVDNFREDVKKAIGLFPANIVLHWDEGFEEFLRHYKKRKKIKREDTVEYYKKLFAENLEGKQLTPELVDFVVNHRNKWLRNVFRHYVQYLYHRRRIPLETFGWIMEVVPSRSYRLDVRVYRIDLELFGETMEFLKQRHELYYLYYLLMYYSGIRLEHVVKLVESYSPDEAVYIKMLDDYSPRLVCFKDFCRYYMGYEGGKPCEWVYFPRELLVLLEKYRGVKRDRSSVSDFARSHNLLRPKFLRKLNWRLLTKIIPDKDVARFIQSRFGELKISESVYGDLLTEADTWYPKAMEVMKKGVEDIEFLKNILEAKNNR